MVKIYFQLALLIFYCANCYLLVFKLIGNLNVSLFMGIMKFYE